MRKLAAVVLLGVMCGAVVAEDAIRFPKPPAPPTPPAPLPGAAEVLASDQLYVIDSDVPLVVIAIPPGFIKVAGPEAGPLKIRAKFVDSVEVETRTYNGKAIYEITAVRPGLTTLLVFPVGFRNPSEMIQRQIQTVIAPQPPPPTPPVPPTPPEPTPPTPPVPPPTPPEPEPEPEPEGPWSLKWAKPTPLPGGGVRVLLMYDALNPASITGPQRAILFGQATRSLLDATCAKGPDRVTPDYRIYRADVNATGENPIWPQAIGRKRSALNWMIISNGNRYIDGPLATDPDHFATLLNKVKTAKQ